MPYISRMTNTTMPWVKASPNEEQELEAEYGGLEIIVLPTRMKGGAKVSQVGGLTD